VEWRTWEALRDQACAEHAGRWAGFKGTAVTGYWDAYEEALTAGYLLHGLEPFLVLHVAEVDTIHHILT
nr:hypothetical protein [Gemmatales bacterium]